MASSASFPSVPPVLKAIQSYMKIASDLEKLDPVIGYWCRFYVVQNGLRIDSKSKESVTFLTAIMGWLEKEKKLRHDNEAITNEMVGQAHVENYALQLFNKADNDDREGRANRNTSRLFLISANLFEVLSVFGEVPEEMSKRVKYAKWKAVYISKCIKNGETPIPGPAAGTDAEDFDAYDIQSGNSNYENTNTTVNNNKTNEPIFPNSAPSDSSSARTPSSITALNGVTLAADDLVKAQKLCKFAGSALQYEDIPEAINNLQKALALLTTGNENI